MGKFKIKVSAEGVKKGQESGDFEDPPAGLYVVEVRKADEKTKDGGQYPYLNVGAVPVGLGKDNKPLNPPEGVRWGMVWDKVSSSPAAEWRMTQFALAMGLKVNAKGEIIGDLELEEGRPGSIIGKLALLRVKDGKDQNDNRRAEAGGWYPYDSNDAGNDGFEDEAEDEIANEEPDVDEPFDDDEDGTDDDYYTADYLESLIPKDLSAVCAEFDLDAGDLKVFTGRGKTRKVDVAATKEAMIAAILEAQGADEESDEDGAEDPF